MNLISKTKKKNLVNERRKVMFGLLIFALIQIGLVVLAKCFSEQVINFFDSLNDYYYLDIISKIFFALKGKLAIASAFVSLFGHIFVTSKMIRKPRTKKEKRYNKVLKFWRTCFIQLSACIITYYFAIAILICILHHYSEYLELKTEI